MQESDINKFLESGLLEEYVLGLTTELQNEEVRRHIAASDSVRKRYEALQQDLEVVAGSVATNPPAGLRSRILSQLKPAALAEGEVVPEVGHTNVPQASGSVRRLRLVAIAASVIALVCAGVALTQWMRSAALEQEVKVLTNQVDALQSDVESKTLKLVDIEEKVDQLNDPETERHILRGNQQAPDFRAVAYWNRPRKTCYLKVHSLPRLSNDRVYQLWADVHGEMINMGVIPNEQDDLIALDFKVDAESLNVTIEPAGGSEAPTVERLVASVGI